MRNSINNNIHIFEIKIFINYIITAHFNICNLFFFTITTKNISPQTLQNLSNSLTNSSKPQNSNSTIINSYTSIINYQLYNPLRRWNCILNNNLFVLHKIKNPITFFKFLNNIILNSSTKNNLFPHQTNKLIN